ncbi:MAG: iron-containing alcohol dehydrogenase [Planctomycetota bacterium]|jgi:alcohol dehydrogenase|nr:iron-containing alcohol dehydrogenase [Planctomycetota bacterium]
MEFVYSLPVKIIFGRNRLESLADVCRGAGLQSGLLVCDSIFAKNGLAERTLAAAKGCLTGAFSELSSNPDVSEVDACAERIAGGGCRFLVALGGGSAMDCAKAASVVAGSGKPARHYHCEKGAIAGPGLPVIAIPTTAGTGSEVTNVAVLTDSGKGIKGPMASDWMYVKIALIDPLLTLSVPPQVTASTGLDVLSHALEGFWSRNHQPICDAAALPAARLVFENLQEAYDNGENAEARENLCLASLMAGLAFAHPKTAASHACSFPLTNVYHLPHGEACAFTLDSLTEINRRAEDGRLDRFAVQLGFSDALAMAGRIREMKKAMRMKCTLAEAGIPEGDLERLVESCRHPNLLNNPVEMTPELLLKMFRGLA